MFGESGENPYGYDPSSLQDLGGRQNPAAFPSGSAPQSGPAMGPPPNAAPGGMSGMGSNGHGTSWPGWGVPQEEPAAQTGGGGSSQKPSTEFGPQHTAQIFGAAGEAVDAWQKTQAAQAYQQLQQVQAQKAQQDAAYRQQIAALRARTGLKNGFMERYGIMVIILGLVIGGGALWYFSKRRK